jgi:hypothetical protein
MSLGFTKSDAYSNLYYKVEYGFPLILVLYVDYLFLTGDEKLIDGCKRELTSEFKMKDLSLMHYFLALKVWQRLDIMREETVREIRGSYNGCVVGGIPSFTG